jgi:ADP-ribose pyrophosphatase YjhB (NUDIX family)
MPGIWAATGGAAIAGETSKQAASRELFEELGIKAEAGELRLVKRIKKHNSLLDVWTIKTNCKAPDLKLQKSEVAAAKWVSFDTLNAMVKNKEFHNYGNEYFELVKKLSDDIKADRKALNSNN